MRLLERLGLLLAASLLGCAPWVDAPAPPVPPALTTPADAGASDGGRDGDVCSDAQRACGGLEDASRCAACFRGQCIRVEQQDHQSCVSDIDPLPWCGDEVDPLGSGSPEADAPFLYGAGELWLPDEDGPAPIVPCEAGYLWTLALRYLPTSAALEAVVVIDEQGYTAPLEERGAETTPDGVAQQLHRGQATLCLPYDVTDASREPPLRFGLQLIDEDGLRSARSCGRLTTHIPVPGQRW